MQVNLTPAEFLFLFNILQDEVKAAYDEATVDMYDSIIAKFNVVLVTSLVKAEDDAAFAAWNRAIEKAKKMDESLHGGGGSTEEQRGQNSSCNKMKGAVCLGCHRPVEEEHKQYRCPDMPRPPQKRH